VASRSCGEGGGGLHIQEQYEEGKFRPNQMRQTCAIQQRNRFSEYRKKKIGKECYSLISRQIHTDFGDFAVLISPDAH
jgi:hypothetical protein